MKYKPTLLNIAAIVLLITDNYIHWSAYAAGEVAEYGLIGLVLSLLLVIFGLLIDFILQRSLKNHWHINGIELVLLLLVTGLYFHNTREKTIIVPEDFTGSFTIVYGVNGAEPLFASYPMFGYVLDIENSRLIYTETALKKDVWNTKFQTGSGKVLDKHEPDPDVTELALGQFNCNGEEWKYRTWLIRNRGFPVQIKNLDSILESKISGHCEEMGM